jgi:hypothetical protein
MGEHMPSVWMKSPGGELVAMDATSYATEDELQGFIADHPEILASTLSAGDQVTAWLLIRRELAIMMEEGDDRTRWSLDHLFIDGDGVPTLVEVKRSSDPRARREVIAQMLDYAASFRHYWTAEALRTVWGDSVALAGGQRAEVMESFLQSTTFADEDSFWGEVQTRIAANQLRLVFVGDRFSPHLVRIIEYLNEQLLTTEVVGVEVVPHADAEMALVAYVPTVRGRTASVPRAKSTAERRTPQDFDEMLRENHGELAVQSVRELVDRVASFGGFSTFGTDARNPRLFINFKTNGVGKVYWPLEFNSRPGTVAIQLRWLANHPAFASESCRTEIVARVSKAVGTVIDVPRPDGFPGFPVRALSAPGVVEGLAEVLHWMTEMADAESTSREAVAADQTGSSVGN